MRSDQLFWWKIQNNRFFVAIKNFECEREIVSKVFETDFKTNVFHIISGTKKRKKTRDVSGRTDKNEGF